MDPVIWYTFCSWGRKDSNIILIPCNEAHRHTEIDFRDGNKNRGVALTDHLVDAEKALIMSYEGVGENGYQTLADSNQCVPWDIFGNDVYNLLVACKDISAVCAVPGFEKGISDEIDAFMMALEEHSALHQYLKSSLNYHRTLLVKCPPAPTFVALGKTLSDKTDSLAAA